MSDKDKQIADYIGFSMTDFADGLGISPTSVVKGVKGKTDYLTIDRLLEALRTWQAKGDHRAIRIRNYLARELKKHCLPLPGNEVPLDLGEVLEIGPRTFWCVRSAAQLAPHSRTLKESLLAIGDVSSRDGTLAIACQAGTGSAIMELLVSIFGIEAPLSRRLAVMELSFGSPEYVLAVDEALGLSGFSGTVNGYLPMPAGDKENLLAFLLAHGVDIFQDRFPALSRKPSTGLIKAHWRCAWRGDRLLAALATAARRDPNASPLGIAGLMDLVMDEAQSGKALSFAQSGSNAEIVKILAERARTELGMDASDWIMAAYEEFLLRSF